MEELEPFDLRGLCGSREERQGPVTRRQHLRDAALWARDTQGKDWKLKKVRKYPGEAWQYRYLWVGPNGAFHICLGTEKSVEFLHVLRYTLKEFRERMAAQFDHSPLVQAVKAEGEGAEQARYV